MAASSAVRMNGPAARTVVLLLPQFASAALAATGAVSPSIATGAMMGVQTRNLLEANSAEGLLGYARLLFAQPQGGKLSVLGGAGNKVYTITSWDPGQQTLESIIRGFAQWKSEESISFDIQLAVHEAIQMLIQSPGKCKGDKKKVATVGSQQEESTTVSSKNCVPEFWKAVQMARTRLIVITIGDCGAGSSVEVYHRMIVEAFLKIDMRSSDVECCDALFLDLSNKDKISNSCVCMQSADNGIQLSTSFYKLQPSCTADLLLDLAYLHLELSAIAVQGLATLVLHQSVKKAGGTVSSLVKREEDEQVLEHNLASETDLRLVLCQAPLMAPPGGYCFTPTGGELRKSRTMFLLRVRKPITNSQLLTLPCTSITPALLEVPLSRSAAQLWETVKVEEVDSDGHVILALSSERNSLSVTHVLVWHLERFWLHSLQLRNGRDDQVPDTSKVESHLKLEELTDDKVASRSQEGPSISGKIADDKTLVTRKRIFEEVEESGNQVNVTNLAIREKKGYKQLERPTRCYPLTSPETVIGGPDRHSASLAALLVPIRGVFMSEDPASELVDAATKCVARLMELTEKNDGSLFPHASEIPVARRELYKKMWWELKRLAKRTRKDKTQGQEDLAQAIRAARADCKTSEQQFPQPLPALTEKQPTEHVHINKRRRCEEVPRDIHGRPIFPIKLGPSLQVYDLGNVVWNRPAFHSDKYIWPAGYKSRRAYASMLNSENRIFYWCEIVDDGQAPEFRLTPEDDENNPVIGISATAVWTVVVKRVGALRLEEGGKKTFANVSGPEYFGFANPTIARLIQQLPNSEKCTKYKRQDYFPNVPMRATELDAWQGSIANECASSPQRKESVVIEGKDVLLQSSPVGLDDDDMDKDRAEECGTVRVPEEDEAGVQRQQIGTTERVLRGMSWDSDEFRKAATRDGKLCLAEFCKHFLVSNSGSLFSYYWSAKLRRTITEAVELDGRK